MPAQKRSEKTTILLIGSPADPLIRRVVGELNSRDMNFQLIEENQLFSNVTMEYERDGRDVRARIRADGISLGAEELLGVVSRLPRTWWPKGFTDLQDQMFVYHESTAAWYNFLAFLPCRVVNQFPLAWWLQDLNFSVILGKQFSQQLSIPFAPADLPRDYTVRLVPTGPSTERDVSSVYVVGDKFVSTGSSSHSLIRYFTAKKSALRQWQADNGVYLCRLDVRLSDETLTHIEAFPLLEDEPDEVTQQIASAITEVLL